MKEILQKIRYKAFYLKQYMHRTASYLALINSAMILYLVLSRMKETGAIDFEIEKYFFIFVILGLVMLTLIGWFEIKVLKGMQVESRIGFSLSPPFTEMSDKINDLWEQRNKDTK